MLIKVIMSKNKPAPTSDLGPGTVHELFQLHTFACMLCLTSTASFSEDCLFMPTSQVWMMATKKLKCNNLLKLYFSASRANKPQM